MDVKAKLQEIVASSLREAFEGRLSADEILSVAVIEVPRDTGHGDLATSACLKLAKILRAKPIDIATQLAPHIQSACEAKLPGILKSVEALPPGFINFHLGIGYFRDLVREVAAGGYGRSTVGAGAKVDIEFVSANPTGPLTVAHGRQAAVGDCLANIMAYAGFEVTREYYLNDTGGQIRKLGASVLSHYATAAGGKYPFPEDGYQGDYVAGIAGRLFEARGDSLLGADESEAVLEAGNFAADELLRGIKSDLAHFRVDFDVWFSQRSIEQDGAVEELMKSLWERDLVYKADGAVWMKVSEYGDEKDRVVIKSDGDFTYRTPDIAYHENKFSRGFDRVVDLLGPDHHGHIITMEAAMRAAGHPVEAFHGLIVQFCTLWRGSEKLKMSTRAGQFVTLREVFEEVGVDAARYFFTARKTDAPLDFDLELAKERAMDNPVYYIQYMSARLSGVVEKASGDERFADEVTDGLYLPQSIDLSPLGEEDLAVLRALPLLGPTIEKAALDYEPHRLCTYLHELAGLFHNYYSRCRFVSEDTELSRARLYVASAIKVLVRELLGLIGVTAPDKM